MKLFSATTNAIKAASSATPQPKTHLQPSSSLSPQNLKFSSPTIRNAFKITSFSNPNVSSNVFYASSSSTTARAASGTATETWVSDNSTFLPRNDHHHWIVVMEKPVEEEGGFGFVTKSDFIDYYVKTLARVLGSEKEAQMSIYNASWRIRFGFCCDIDEEASRKLACLPGVLSVRPDPDIESVEKDYSLANANLSSLSNANVGSSHLFPQGSDKYWLVRMEKPAVEVVTKAQMVDHYVQILTKVLGNVKDAEMCIYHASWQNDFGFCCVLDDECAWKLTGVPGVMSVVQDKNFGSENKDYGGDETSSDSPDSADEDQIPNVKTKRLFITGLSFYTSEKTLRAAFEGFGELVEVKIIMDKISKRSKGYAFLEYTTEEAAGAALKEMNGKIINGWMIVVDVAKMNPPKYSRARPRPVV